MLAVNLRGVFLGTKYAARQMKDQEPDASGDRGFIINVASILGLNGTAGQSEYQFQLKELKRDENVDRGSWVKPLGLVMDMGQRYGG